jgi:uncharacterized protein YecT (DUF1311 family)
MKHCFCAVVFLASCLSLSQDSPQYRTCNKKAVTQLELNSCASDEAKRVDDELNRVYKLLLSTVADDTVATAKIKAAQRAWIAYRNAYIDAMYPAEDKRLEYGSVFPMEEALLRAKLTRQQTDALRDILKENEPQ